MLLTGLKTLVYVSKACPRLPKISLEVALPWLGMPKHTHMSQMIMTTYQVYTNINETIDTFQQPVNLCYSIYRTGKSTYEMTKNWIKPSPRSKLCSAQFQYLCDDETSEWVLLFPDDEHKFHSSRSKKGYM